MREFLKKGQMVNVLVTPAPGVVKRKPARVLDVLRAAALLEFEGGIKRKVVFSEIEFPDDVPEPPRKPPERKALQLPVHEQRPREPVTRAEVATPERLAQVRDALHDFQALLDMSGDVLESMQVEAAQLLQTSKALHAERDAVDAELDRVQREHADIQSKLDLLKSLRKFQAAGGGK